MNEKLMQDISVSHFEVTHIVHCVRLFVVISLQAGH